MTSSAANELSEALTRLQGERETILDEIATIERDLGEKHEALADANEKIAALEKTLAVLRPEQAHELQEPPPPEDKEEVQEQEPGEAATAAAFSVLPRQTAVLGILAGATEAMHYQEIAEIAGAPASSVSPNLSHLKYRDLVESTDPGTYRLAPVLALEGEQEANEALRAVATAIVDDRQWDILEAVYDMDERLPFVGFEHFRRNRLANVTGVRWANDRLTHALMKEMLGRELIEVYHTDNPRNPEFPTAAIRLTAEGLDEIEE